ncbi:MAG TPA: RNA pseudouridine synthase, partial [Azospirillum sp.]|nr:RNA pseudouridine synthase [Azospirillum sp.]
WRLVTAEDGQSAVTDYEVLGRAGGMSWVAFHPHTGRTHQIRVHAASMGCPLLGDPQYGGPEGRLHLHSRAVELPLYPKKPAVAATAPVPAHMLAALTACGFDPDRD